MKAIRVVAPGEVRVAELPVPGPPSGETLVRVAVAGICATDHRLAARGTGAPRVLGHEVTGWLEDKSAVGVHPDIGCGRCRFCRAGFENRCPDRTSIGIHHDGGLAEYLTVPVEHVVSIGTIPLLEAALLEPLACCLHAVDMLEVEDGDPALVVGAGSMGLLALWALQSRGARVVVSQRSEGRRRQAADLGAYAGVGAGEDPSAALGETPRVAIVTAPTSGALGYALDVVAVGGRVHAFAGMPEGGMVDGNIVHYRHLTLTGSTGSRLADYRMAIDLVEKGKVDLSRLPTRVVTLEEAARILVGGRHGDGAKVLVELDKGGDG